MQTFYVFKGRPYFLRLKISGEKTFNDFLLSHKTVRCTFSDHTNLVETLFQTADFSSTQQKHEYINT